MTRINRQKLTDAAYTAAIITRDDSVDAHIMNHFDTVVARSVTGGELSRGQYRTVRVAMVRAHKANAWARKANVAGDAKAAP